MHPESDQREEERRQAAAESIDGELRGPRCRLCGKPVSRERRSGAPTSDPDERVVHSRCEVERRCGVSLGGPGEQTGTGD